MSSSGLNYLITGASRGIGRAYVEALLKKPGKITVVAAVRDVHGDNAKALATVEHAAGNRLITVKIDTTSDGDAAEAVEQLQKQHSIDHLDVVVHNAGAVLEWGPIAKISPEGMRAMYDVNATSILSVFQATKSLLDKSKLTEGKFIYIGSGGGSMTDIKTYATHLPAAYFASKCAGHYLLRLIALQEAKLCVSCITPGMVASGLGGEAVAKAQMDMEKVKAQFASLGLTSTEDCASALVFTVDAINRETGHDKFFSNMQSLAEGKLVESPW